MFMTAKSTTKKKAKGRGLTFMYVYMMIILIFTVHFQTQRFVLVSACSQQYGLFLISKNSQGSLCSMLACRIFMYNKLLTFGACAWLRQLVCVCECVCLYLSVTKLAATCILCSLKLGHCRVSLWHLQQAENTLFKSYGVICLPSPPPTVPDGLSMNRSNSDGIF